MSTTSLQTQVVLAVMKCWRLDRVAAVARIVSFGAAGRVVAKTLVGVVYDTHTLAIRRIIIPHDDSHLPRHLGPGESMATSLRMFGHSLDRAYEIVRQKTGRQPPDMADVHAADQVARSLGNAPVR